MRYVFTEALTLGAKKGEIQPGDFQVLLDIITKNITWHSPRVRLSSKIQAPRRGPEVRALAQTDRAEHGVGSHQEA